MLSAYRRLMRHVVYNYESGGLRQVLGKVLFRAKQAIWSQEEWLVYQIAVPAGEPAAPAGQQFVSLNFQQLKALKYFKAEWFPDAIQERIERGSQCFGVLVSGELANVGWTTRGMLELDGSLSIPCEDGAGIFDCFTMSAFRGRGLYPESLRAMLQALYRQGAKQVFIAVDPGNIASIKGIERTGFRPLYHLCRRRRFGLRLLDKRPFQAKFQP